MTLREVLERLHLLSNPEKVTFKEQKFGITAKNALGIYHTDLRELAKEIGVDNSLALELFDSGIYEARILCSKIFDPSSLTEEQMDLWVATFETWEICDSFCMGLFAKSSHAIPKALEWSHAKEEFIKRAGFVLMAAYGFADKHASNEVFEQFFPHIQQEAPDERIYVKKAISWALRSIGKRNQDLKNSAILHAEKVIDTGGKSTTWIAKDVLKELTSTEVKLLDYPRILYRKQTPNTPSS